MKIILIIIILIFSINTANAQLSGQAKIDSLLKELPKMKKDTNGVMLLRNISFEYSLINPDVGIKYGKKGVTLAKKIGWKDGQANCLNAIGNNYKSGKADFENGRKFYDKSLKIYEELENKRGISGCLNNIGMVYSQQSEYSIALDYFFKALKFNEKINNKEWISNNFMNIGNVYHRQLNYPKALEYYHKALKISEELKNEFQISGIFLDIGLIYQESNEHKKALEFFYKSLKLCEKYGIKMGISANFMNIGLTYKHLSEYSKSIEFYSKALEISEKVGNNLMSAITLGNIGALYLMQANDSIIENIENSKEFFLKKEVNLNKAIEYLKQTIEKLSEIRSVHPQVEFYENLSQAYELKGNYKNAFETYKEFKKLQDSVFSSENQTKIANLEAKRENELKEKEIVILKKEKENEKLQRYAMFGGIAGLGIIIGLILIQRRKSEKLLLNVLPDKIAKRLKAKEHPIADHFDGASIIFVDIVGFTSLSSDVDPKRIVSVLNDIFTIFDKLADKHGLEKIKTIGDAYMAVVGIPEIQADHSRRAAQMALDIKSEIKDFKTSDGTEIKFRIGIDCGAVVAGVIGEKKFIYDLWSDAVNTASRMESTGESGQIQITENFKDELEKFDGNWNFTFRGEFEIKGKGFMKTYFLEK